MKSNQRFLIFWVEAIKTAVEKQANSLKEYGMEIGKPDPFPKGLSKTNLHVDKLKAITPIEMVQTFVTNKSTQREIKFKLLYRLVSSIDLLDNIQSNCIDLLEIVTKALREYKDEWDVANKELNSWRDEMWETHGNNLSANPFINDFFEVIGQWGIQVNAIGPEDRRPVELTKIYFIDKIRPVIEKHFPENPSNPEIIKLNNLVLALNMAYHRRKINMAVWQKAFQDSSKNLAEVYERLSITTNRISKLKFRCFLFLE